MKGLGISPYTGMTMHVEIQYLSCSIDDMTVGPWASDFVVGNLRSDFGLEGIVRHASY